MALYTDLIPCPRGGTGAVCKSQLSAADMPSHLAWHDNIKASVLAANPVVSLTLLNGL